MDLVRLMEQIKNLMNERFTGNIKIHFHKGSISKKVEKTSPLSDN